MVRVPMKGKRARSTTTVIGGDGTPYVLTDWWKVGERLTYHQVNNRIVRDLEAMRDHARKVLDRLYEIHPNLIPTRASNQHSQSAKVESRQG